MKKKYVDKLDNLSEMHKFLEKHKLLKFSRSVTKKNWINNQKLPTKEKMGSECLIVNSTKCPKN